MPDISARDFPDVYEALGIDTAELGCIMLDTDPIQVSDIVPLNDLYVEAGEDILPEKAESEEQPHVTLLYGLLRSGPELKYHVDKVLEGWEAEQPLKITEVNFFYGQDDTSRFISIVALLEPNSDLLDANSRLRLLPHIDTFPEYKPHITLAYVKYDAKWQDYVDKLNQKYAGTTVKPVAINYGH